MKQIKTLILAIILLSLISVQTANADVSVCTKTYLECDKKVKKSCYNNCIYLCVKEEPKHKFDLFHFFFGKYYLEPFESCKRNETCVAGKCTEESQEQKTTLERAQVKNKIVDIKLNLTYSVGPMDNPKPTKVTIPKALTPSLNQDETAKSQGGMLNSDIS